MFKPNDMVVAMNVEGTRDVLKQNQVYRVEYSSHRGKFLRLENVPYEFASARFEKFPFTEPETIRLPIAGNQ